MCGRFSLRVELEELIAFYDLAQVEFPYTPRYNIAPGQRIPAVIEASTGRRLGPLRWGLVPSWSKDDKAGQRMMNARADSLHTKPSFKHLFTTKRCVIPADGFYEWRKADKQPFRITLADDSLFSLAALYDTWVSPNGERISTCTVITTEPNSLMGAIHERMPVIVPKERLSEWLDKETQPTKLQSLLTPLPAELMRAYPVSPVVGNVRNDVPECIAPYTPPEVSAVDQIEFF